ncbi:acyl-CoA N-acyltransferase [Corynespora cassiicola Philippines]|uniref:Acyl-CoA N-acyltransferase n=1 Tax=Corynespora cassiicola Philippines TaxID=1448308 RepID=A0A2T2P6U8_CORCC|nr:acyl-CoA N-acyltransferase [Corynespora cassiicola Philippines]
MESPVHFASKHHPTYVPAKEREPSIKPASQEEIPYLPTIEHAADAPFRAIGMAAVADMPLPSLEHYAAAQARHHLWVARHPRSPSPSSIVGFYQIKALQHTPDFRAALLTQISILPGYSRRGLGTLMLRYLIDYASVLGYQSVDLTTFDEVPWNRAFYEKVGFKGERGRG